MVKVRKWLPSFKRNFPKVFFLLLAFLIFWALGAIFLDPDFGWHLRTGQIILSSGVPKTDPFSYSMKSFPYVDHEWLTNVLIAWLYPVVGFWGLAGIWAATAALSLLIASEINLRKEDPGYFRSAALFLAGGAVLTFGGVRPQVISWLFWALFLKISLEVKVWQKFKYILPLLFLAWVNLHGGFPIGILTLFLLIALRTFQKKKVVPADGVILGLSFGATLINPYGLRMWERILKEMWLQSFDSSLRWRIVEWFPSISSLNFSYWALVVLSIFLIYRYRKKFLPETILLFSIFLFQALASQRHVPLWVVISLPVINRGIYFLREEVAAIKFGLLRFQKSSFFFLLGAMVLAGMIAAEALVLPFFSGQKGFYPKKAVEYLKINLPGGEIFSKYDWGGYLIWNLPEKKVFIDGRMPAWQMAVSPPGESNNVMRDYIGILSGKTDYRPIFDQYQVRTVFWSKPEESNSIKLPSFLKRLLVKKESFDFLEQLQKDKWLKVYEDEVAVIYQRPN